MHYKGFKNKTTTLSAFLSDYIGYSRIKVIKDLFNIEELKIRGSNYYPVPSFYYRNSPVIYQRNARPFTISEVTKTIVVDVDPTIKRKILSFTHEPYN